MRTELEQHFTHGFILTEQELWRINDDMMQQMKRGTKDDIISFFRLKYKNGVKAEKASLNEVISENNSGKWEIQELKMGVLSKSRPQRAKIEIEFRVPPAPANKDNTQRPHSIYYYVLGDERNWVYLTSSQLDDRIAKIKRLPIFYYGTVAIFIGVVFGILIFALPNASHPVYIPLGYQIISYIASVLMIVGGITAMYCFPLYNFCWGDYMQKFTNRRTLGGNILIVIIIGLVISVLGSIIGTLFFQR